MSNPVCSSCFHELKSSEDLRLDGLCLSCSSQADYYNSLNATEWQEDLKAQMYYIEEVKHEIF